MTSGCGRVVVPVLPQLKGFDLIMLGPLGESRASTDLHSWSLKFPADSSPGPDAAVYESWRR